MGHVTVIAEERCLSSSYERRISRLNQNVGNRGRVVSINPVIGIII